MIEYLDHHGSDSAIANSARVSFADFGDWNDIAEGYTEERQTKLISYLATHRHLTPFRHNSISIRCKAPIFIARQLGKHQAGLSWNEVSRRYVKGGIEFHTPESWRAAPEGSIKQGSAGEFTGSVINPIMYGSEHEAHVGAKDSAHGVYEDLLEMCLTVYSNMLDAGVAPEQARMVLPQSMMTEWVWTGNLLAFAHIYNERIASGAQLEAQEFARELDKVIRPLFPEGWEALTGHNK